MAEKEPKTLDVDIVRNCVVNGQNVIVKERRAEKAKPKRMTLPTPTARYLVACGKAQLVKSRLATNGA